MSKKAWIIAIICVVSLVIFATMLAIVGIAVGVSLGIASNLRSTLSTEFSITPSTQPTEFSITIDSALPSGSGQSFSEGFIDLAFSLPSNIEIQNNVMISIDGVEIISLKEFPNNFQIPTNGLTDGSHIVSMTAVSTNNNNNGFGQIQVQVEDPRLELVSLDFPLEIYPGLSFTISVEVSGSASHFEANFFALLGQNAIVNSTGRIGNILTHTQTIPVNLAVVEGFYPIPLRVFSTDQRILIIPGITVFFQSAVTSPFAIDGGIIDRRSFPEGATTDMSLNFTLPPDFQVALTTGQTVDIPLEVDGDSNASSILVGFEGFGQHFSIPVSSLQSSNSRRSVRASTIRYNVRLTLPSGSMLSGTVRSTRVLIRLLDNLGRFGPITRVRVTLASSQLGTLHARLSWDRDVDLDLHMVDPNGEEIYFGDSRSSGQVGFLDLDSICGSNGNIENIFYEQAISGRYIVRVELFSSCSVSSTISFDLLVEGCNITQTVSGVFQPSDANSGGLGAGREILNFIADCNRFLAEGTVSYVGPIFRNNPLGSIVRVVDSSGSVLGQSEVRRNPTNARSGAYSVPYEANDINQPVYIEFLSANNMIDVTDHAGNTHIYRSDNSIIPATESTARRDVLIRQVNGSGAFHIMTTLARMIPLYLAYGGRRADYPIKADWELGEFARGSNGPVSFFSTNTKILSIGGHPTDPDEFDDSVLLHEFGHLINDNTGAVITGGGSHSSRRQISPNFAFSEGFATYLGQKVIGNLMYCDGFCRDFSDLVRIGVPLGTNAANDNSAGSLSEGVVASAAFRLDFDIGLGMGIKESLTDPDQLLREINYNRLGDPNAVDFADMVSIVVCRLGGNKRNTSAQLLENEYRLPWIAEDQFCQ